MLFRPTDPFPCACASAFGRLYSFPSVGRFLVTYVPFAIIVAVIVAVSLLA